MKKILMLVLALSLTALPAQTWAQDCTPVAEWCIPTPDGFAVAPDEPNQDGVAFQTLHYGTIENAGADNAQISVILNGGKVPIPALDLPAITRLGFYWGFLAGAVEQLNGTLIVPMRFEPGAVFKIENGYQTDLIFGQSAITIVTLEGRPTIIMTYHPGQYALWDEALTEVLTALE